VLKRVLIFFTTFIVQWYLLLKCVYENFSLLFLVDEFSYKFGLAVLTGRCQRFWRARRSARRSCQTALMLNNIHLLHLQLMILWLVTYGLECDLVNMTKEQFIELSHY